MIAGLMFGPLGALVLYMFAIGAICTFSANALLRSYGAMSFPASVGLCSFVLFNPWTYTEVVAGHTSMILAFGGLLGVIAQLKREHSNPYATSLLSAIVFAQLQFFMVLLPLLAVDAIRRRRSLPLVTAVVVALPVTIGILGNLTALLNLPFALEWQRSQSVDPVAAPLLLGYFMPYADQYGGWLRLPMVLILGVVILGAVSARRDRFAQAALWASVLLLLATLGLRGPLGPAYAALVQHFPPVGLYRELYDLIGCVALGYAVLLARAAWAYRRGPAALLVGGLLCAGVWFSAPPNRWWVSQSELPGLSVDLPANTRYALMPAIQPMNFLGRGSGADPDLLYLRHDVWPLNEYFAAYPVNAVLARYSARADSRELGALGVAAIYSRPWLRTNAVALADQSAEPGPFPTSAPAGTIRLPAAAVMPLLAVTGLPRIGTLDTELGANAAFFGDVAHLGGAWVPPDWDAVERPDAVVVSNTQVRADRGWVDARLDYIAHPELAQAFGGAMTTSRAFLPIAGGASILGYVDGTLRDQRGRVVARGHGDYRWVPLDSGVRAVGCDGRCAVALRGHPPDLPLNPPAQAFSRPPFGTLMPWLLWARVGDRVPRVLRLNEAYDPHWIAVDAARPLVHFRLDAAVNGWIVPPQSPGQIAVVYVPAVFQFVFEVVGCVWIAVVIVAACRSAAGGGLDPRRLRG
jgi:hypothetical protein